MLHRTALSLATLSLGLALVAAAAGERRAEACGGCFAPPTPGEVTTVDAHRMVIALGVSETILWDQIVYSGDPEDFVWVLPVPSSDVSVEIADPDFFVYVDGGTAPQIRPLSPPPQIGCPPRGGFGCAASASGGGDGTSVPDDGVTVYDEATVGPYEQVTIGADDPDALYAWLNQNGYAVPLETLPTIDYYVGIESVFVVLRLAPGEGVNAMQPVRVHYTGYMGTFPLKMVVVGAQGVLDLALWVIAEQRYEARNYGTVRIDDTELAWDWATNTSNYDEVFEQTVERAGNRAWVVEHAGPLATVGTSPGSGIGADDAYEELTLVRDAVPNAYVTRLRTSVLVDHIDQDLELTPSADPSDVSSDLLAPIDLNRPADVDCDDGCSGTGARAGGAVTTLGMIVLGVALVTRRRRRGRRLGS